MSQDTHELDDSWDFLKEKDQRVSLNSPHPHHLHLFVKHREGSEKAKCCISGLQAVRGKASAALREALTQHDREVH